MKKFLKILFSLILVVVIAIAGLITFVDPNDYRGYMVEKVREKTGYALEINGDLRWHVWPQVSILVDDVTVTAPGAADKMVRAENMRLDVELIPLFSKQLAVKEVFVKGAVIRLTDDTNPVIAEKTQPQTQTPEQPQVENGSAAETAAGAKAAQEWSLQLNRFEIANSMFVLQQSENRDDLLTVRNINALLSMKGERQVNLSASSSINRNRQDITAAIKANADLRQYPQQVSLTIDELNYQLQGNGFPTNGINGKAVAKIDYNLDNKNIALTGLKVIANNEVIEGNVNGSLGDIANLSAKLTATTSGGVINGQIDGTLGDIPELVIALSGDSVNIDKLTAAFAAVPQNKAADAQTAPNSETPADPAPVAVSNDSAAKAPNPQTSGHELAFLNDLNATLTLNVKSLIVDSMTINNVAINADNRQGNVQLNALSGQLLGGSVSATGSINAKGEAPFVQLNPKIANIDMDKLSQMLDITQTLSGRLNMSGEVSGSGLNARAIKNGWNAELTTRIDNARLNNLNLKQIIHQAAALSNREVKADERYEQYTEVRQLSALVLLQKGTVRLNKIAVDSEALTVGGSGSIGLANMACDINLNVKVLQGWQGKKDVVDILQSTAIPVHIYGPCSNLAYKVDVEKIIRDQLKNQASKAIERYLGGDSQDRKAAAADKIFGEIIGRRR